LRCLWITPQLPFPPFHGGDALYSSGLIRSLAGAGAAITVVCNDNGGDPPPPIDGVDWVVIPFRDRSRAASIPRRVPSIVHRFSTPQLRESVADLVRHGQWDGIILDTLAVADAVDPGSKVVYVSHNHEESVRRQLASAYPWASPMRAAMSFDARKAARLEQRLVDAAALVTTTTQADADQFRLHDPDQRYVVLAPGYSGTVAPARAIGPQTPRRVLLLGSYKWAAKRLNLAEFLDQGARRLTGAGVGIDVVGPITPELAARLKRHFPDLRIAGELDDLRPVFQDARIGLVVEAVGGGFKLKVLDYVFNRLPVLALSGSVDGMPLVADQSILVAGEEAAAMAECIIGLIDDFDRLNRIQEAAFRACAGQFDWPERGAALARAIGSLNQ
jgi:glycosyltransferase involved in cell wall biosynthesis